jgi:hypothetical protein
MAASLVLIHFCIPFLTLFYFFLTIRESAPRRAPAHHQQGHAAVAPPRRTTWRPFGKSLAPQRRWIQDTRVVPRWGCATTSVVEILQWRPLGKAELWSHNIKDAQSGLAPSRRPRQQQWRADIWFNDKLQATLPLGHPNSIIVIHAAKPRQDHEPATSYITLPCSWPPAVLPTSTSTTRCLSKCMNDNLEPWWWDTPQPSIFSCNLQNMMWLDT